MYVWARQDLSVGAVDFVGGWQLVDDAIWDKIKGGNRVANLEMAQHMKHQAEPPPEWEGYGRQIMEITEVANDVAQTETLHQGRDADDDDGIDDVDDRHGTDITGGPK